MFAKSKWFVLLISIVLIAGLIAGSTLAVERSNSDGFGVALYDQVTGTYYIKDTLDDTEADRDFRYGPADNSFLPVAGDWDGDGIYGIALYDQEEGRFLVKDDTEPGFADREFRYGPKGNDWLPVAGDWTGDGVYGVALYDQEEGIFLVKDDTEPGFADREFRYGPKDNDWLPVAGDWTGDGVYGVALYDQEEGIFLVKDDSSPGFADREFRYGPVNNDFLPTAGDWTGDGVWGVALYDQSEGQFLVKYDSQPGWADLVFSFGPADNNWLPVAGKWMEPEVPETYSVTFTDPANGVLRAEVDGDEINSGDEVEKGKDVKFILEPDDFYELDSWIIRLPAMTTSEVDENLTYTYKNLDRDIEVTAETRIAEEVTVTNTDELEWALEQVEIKTINLADGTYNVAFEVEHNQVVKAENPHEAIIKNDEIAAGGESMIKVTADNARVEGLTVHTQPSDGAPPNAIILNGDNAEAINNKVAHNEDPSGHPLIGGGGDSVIIKGNELYDGVIGIWGSGDVNVIDNKYYGFQAENHGEPVWFSGENFGQLVIENNDFGAMEHGKDTVKIVHKPSSVNGETETLAMYDAIFDDNTGVDTVELSWIINLTFEEGTVELSDAQEAGKWYTDRFAPAGFTSDMFDGDWRLKHSIDENDSKPVSDFYGTQGRKYDTQGSTNMSIDLYIPADWENTDRRMAGFWATGFNADDEISLYPIIEFTSDGNDPRFRVWPEDPSVGGWIDLGLPSDFDYDQWYTLTMELSVDDVTFSVGDLSHTFANNNTVQFGNVILQGYNFDPGVNYDIYWDNFLAWY